MVGKITNKATKLKTSNYNEMVVAAITELKDRKGSSMQAILKYVVATNFIDKIQASLHVKAALKRAVVKGTLQLVTGTGANGFYKLSKLKPANKNSQKLL